MARNFNGTSNYVNLDAVATPVSWWNDIFGRCYAGWINAPAGQSNVGIYAEGAAASNTPFWFLSLSQTNANKLRWNGAGTPTANTTATVADSTWHHIALVIYPIPTTGNWWGLYVDGLLDQSGTMASTVSGSTTNQAALGALRRTTTGNFFKGLIAHWAIWNRALSGEEVRLLARGVLPSEFSPQHYFPLTGPDVVAAKDIGHRRNSGTLVGPTVSANVPPLVRQPRPVKWAERYAGAQFFRSISLTLTGTSSLTASVRKLHRFTATLAGTSSLAATVTDAHRFTAALAGTSSLTASLRKLRRFSATLAGTSSLTAATQRYQLVTATLAGTSSLSASLRLLRRFTATLAGTSSLTATVTTGGAVTPITATLAGTSSLTATLARYQRIVVTLAGTSSLRTQFVVQVESGALQLLGDAPNVFPVGASSGIAQLLSDGAVVPTNPAPTSGVLRLGADPPTIGPLSSPAPGVLRLQGDAPLSAGPVQPSSGVLALRADAPAFLYPTVVGSGVMRLRGDAPRSAGPVQASPGVLRLASAGATIHGPVKMPSGVLRLLGDPAVTAYAKFVPVSGILLLKAGNPVVTPLTPPPPPPPPPESSDIHIRATI